MKKVFLAFSALTVLLYSCKDEDVISKNDLASTQASRDHLIAEAIFNDVERVVEDGFIDNGESKSCPTYSIINSETADESTLIINYGTENCWDEKYGKERRGKIIVLYTGKYRDSLSVMTTTFDDYHVSNNLIQGERIVTNQGRNDSGNMWFTIEVNNASINTSNGTIDWASSRIREWTGGSTTFDIWEDDSYSITGSASGNGVNDNSFDMTITTPLKVDFSCFPSCIIKSGEAKISPSGYSDRIINYGDSICDCNIDVIINGTTYPIKIN